MQRIKSQLPVSSVGACISAIIGTCFPFVHPIVLAAPVAQVQTFRTTLSLSGTWQKIVTSEERTPPTTGWTEVTVPEVQFLGPSGAPQFIWYRREIVIPPAAKNQRLFIHVHGARNAPHLFLDGKKIGGQVDGWSPFRVEITSLALPGSRHRLELRCQDRAVADVSPGSDTAKAIHGTVVQPLGGYKDVIGPWERIDLETAPRDFLDQSSLVIAPSVRNKTLSLSGTVNSTQTGVWVEATVYSKTGNTAALHLPAQQVTGNSSGGWKLTAMFPKAHYWSPEDPYLYRMEVVLRQGSANGPILDRLSTRFGFKELWKQGPDFYLNGVKRHLFAAATWPNADPEAPEVIRQRVRKIRESGAIAFRLHTNPWQEAWLDAADEEGLLIVDEAGVYTDGNGDYRYGDPLFWQNYRDHIAGLIRRDRNHASLAMWSLGNEILFMGNQKYDAELPKKLGDLARFARDMDPSHLNTFEADQDPDGAYDVIGLHYPHELPWHPDYPNTCDWLAASATTEAGGGMLGQKSGEFFWDRKKPLYIGEYLWVPQGDFSVASVFFGDEAFRDRARYHHAAQGRSFYEQTIAYRRAGVSGMCPWATFGFGAVNDNPLFFTLQKEFFRPVAAFWRDYGLRSFAGEKRNLRFDVFNDGPQPQELTLRMRRTDTGALLATQAVSLSPGGYKSVVLACRFPIATRDIQIPVESVLLSGNTVVHRETRTLTVVPKRSLASPAGTRLLIYDPSGAWAGSVPTLAALSTVDPQHTVVVVAPGAVSAKKATWDAATFRGFLDHGGHALVLEQDTLAPLGLGMELVDFPATMAFPLRTSHPLLANMSPMDWQFWRGDNYVTKKQIRRPRSGGGEAVVVTGGQNGLDQAPVVDLAVGNSGRVLFVQALAGSRRGEEPAAQRLIQNAVNLLAERSAASTVSTRGQTLVVSDDPTFEQRLKTLGLATRHTSVGESPSLVNIAVVAIQGDAQAGRGMTPALTEFLNRGGTIYWNAPTETALHAFDATLGNVPNALRVVPTHGGMSLADRAHPLLTGISREDLTYTSVPTGWDRHMDFDTHATDFLFLPTVIEAGSVRRVAATTGNTDKGKAAQGGIEFDRKGSLTIPVTVPVAGLYQINILASGVAENGIAPVLMLGVNDETVTTFAITAAEKKPYPTLVRLTKGKNTVAIRFVNGSDWGSQRHLLVDGLEIGAPVAYPKGVEVLALPGAVVTWNVGRGRVILDGSTWLSNTANATRGDRYASALFANLGARFDTLPVSTASK